MKPEKLLNAEINELLKKRWSPRSYVPEEISDAAIIQLFEAARWTASAFNEQPWHFIYADRKDMEAFRNVHECLVEGNKSWTINASILIITFAKTHFDRNGKVNTYASYDLGAALANMTIQAQDIGLYTHQMAGIQKDLILEKYNVPEGWQPMTMVAIGHLGDASLLEEKLRVGEESAQKRNDLASIQAFNKW